METEYEEYRRLERSKNYEIIYNNLLREIKNIKSKNIDIEDINKLKSFIEEEVKDRIYKKKGIPTYIIRIIILLGNEYELEMIIKINNIFVSEYVTDFQLWIGKEFQRLQDVKNYYVKINQLIGNIENIYFNLPDNWNSKIEILTDIFLIIKQKICDIIFFNNFDNSDYFLCLDEVLKSEQKICQILKDEKKSIIHILAPFTKVYFLQKFKNEDVLDVDIKKTEMKIFTSFISFFKNFENVFTKLVFFKNFEATKNLAEAFESHLIYLLECLKKINISLDYEIENTYDYNNKDFIKIIIVLNTISYLNDCISGLNSSLFCSYKINLTQSLFIKLGKLENKFSGILELYIRNILSEIDFTNNKISNNIIKVFTKNIFCYDLSDLCDDLKNNLIEIIILQILSRIYLLDFDEISAEMMIYDLHELKSFLSQYFVNINSFKILESYLKIFMCSTEDKQTFIDNFKILSNNIFSFRQVVWSLKDKESVINLLEVFEKMEETY